MNEESKILAIRALENLRGDDLKRARAIFGRLSQDEIDSEWGQSGKTPRQILAEYEAFDAQINQAIVDITVA